MKLILRVPWNYSMLHHCFAPILCFSVLASPHTFRTPLIPQLNSDSSSFFPPLFSDSSSSHVPPPLPFSSDNERDSSMGSAFDQPLSSSLLLLRSSLSVRAMPPPNATEASPPFPSHSLWARDSSSDLLHYFPPRCASVLMLGGGEGAGGLISTCAGRGNS